MPQKRPVLRHCLYPLGILHSASLGKWRLRSAQSDLTPATGPIFDERVHQLERWNATDRTLRVTVVDRPSLDQPDEEVLRGFSPALRRQSPADWCMLITWAETVPILDVLRLRGGPRERAVRHTPGHERRLAQSDLTLATGPIFDERVHQLERWNATDRTLHVTVVDWHSLTNQTKSAAGLKPRAKETKSCGLVHAGWNSLHQQASYWLIWNCGCGHPCGQPHPGPPALNSPAYCTTVAESSIATGCTRSSPLQRAQAYSARLHRRAGNRKRRYGGIVAILPLSRSVADRPSPAQRACTPAYPQRNCRLQSRNSPRRR